MLLLENQSNNIERLNNRGGQLLKEERERKQIQKVRVCEIEFFIFSTYFNLFVIF